MGHSRVLSFISQFSASPQSSPPSPNTDYSSPKRNSSLPLKTTNSEDTVVSVDSRTSRDQHDQPFQDSYPRPKPGSPRQSTSPPPYSPPPNNGNPVRKHRRSSSRPVSMVSTYSPPIMDINEDTIPELQPIFSFLNSHSNKLYQEGYFLKLDDQNTQGKPNADRTWSECFAQLVGTVLSLWDAAELDAAGEDGEVLPKFINLTDASIKMIESLPTRSNDEQPLQNILSISTAGRNRYLLHFNSHHSLVQWTAGIRLAMYEYSTLQEAYTGALIAGKGKTLNNIGVVMDRTRFKTEEWVRVRFGAGVPWRRCWCVITPPDEKEYAKMAKELKKRSPYDRSAIPLLKGDIKFYDTRKDGKKQKKIQPIASITDAYSAYALYPQAKSLVDASTLLKIEGNVAIHTDPPSSTEGFVFIMPEVHPAVSGFEMLLRFLFPTWDTYALYGRPGRLVASTLDPRSLMFAMPKHKRYGYLEILDVANLVVEDSKSTWSEREWRKRLKEVTGQRMNTIEDAPPSSHSRSNSNNRNRLSFGSGVGVAGAIRARVGFADGGVSNRASRSSSNPPRMDSAPPDHQRHIPAVASTQPQHVRNISDPSLSRGPQMMDPGLGPAPGSGLHQDSAPGGFGPNVDHGAALNRPVQDFEGMRRMQTPEPVSTPPAFSHGTKERPKSKAYHSPELRRANSRLSSTTLAQLANAGGLTNDAHPENINNREVMEAASGPSVPLHAANSVGMSANDDRSREALSPPSRNGPAGGPPPPLNLTKQISNSSQHSQYGPPSSFGPGPSAAGPRPSTSDGPRGQFPGNRAPPSGHGAPLMQSGRGRPPPGGQRPSPGPVPPSPGPPGNYPPGPGLRGHGGLPGPGGAHVLPERTASLDKQSGAGRNPVTANDIIDQYASDAPMSRGPYGRQPPPDRRPNTANGYSSPGGGGAPYDMSFEGDRPGPGPARTAGGMDHMSNYAAPPLSPRGHGPGGSMAPGFPGPGPQRPYSPAGQRPYSPAGQRPYSPAGQRPMHGGQGRQEQLDGAQRGMPWSPPTGPGMGGQGQSMSHHQQAFYQQMMAERSRTPQGMGGPGGPPPPMHGGNPPPSPGFGPGGGPSSSFSRPMPPQMQQHGDPRMGPPQGPPPGRNVAPHYHGQAF